MKKKGASVRFEVKIGRRILTSTTNQKRARREFYALRAREGGRVKFLEIG